jgi:hypothetical protein
MHPCAIEFFDLLAPMVDRQDNGERPYRRGGQVYAYTIDYATAGRQADRFGAKLRYYCYCSKAAADLPRQLQSAEYSSSAAEVRGSIEWYPPPCVRQASHTRVAHKDFPADEWLRRRLTDISRDSVAVCYRKVSRQPVRAFFALRTSLCLLLKETACGEEGAD